MSEGDGESQRGQGSVAAAETRSVSTTDKPGSPLRRRKSITEVAALGWAKITGKKGPTESGQSQREERGNGERAKAGIKPKKTGRSTRSAASRARRGKSQNLWKRSRRASLVQTELGKTSSRDGLWVDVSDYDADASDACPSPHGAATPDAAAAGSGLQLDHLDLDPIKLDRRVHVAVRMRPALFGEEQSSTLLDGFDESSSCISYTRDVNAGTPRTFSFDQLLSPDTRQAATFVRLGRPIADQVLQGYNATILAYGATGSGKTHTMIGQRSKAGTEAGIVPRMMQYLISSSNRDALRRCRFSASFIEIYNEMVVDLLNPANENLTIREKGSRVFVPGLTTVEFASVEEGMDIMARGEQNRSYHATNLNIKSSRSHVVFVIYLDQEVTGAGSRGVVDKISNSLFMVDLAGSERIKRSGATGAQLAEARAINKSLSVLGSCVNALANKNPGKYVPYRDSKLTRLLSKNLGGAAKTVLVVCISPRADGEHEMESALKFGQRARNVQVNAKIGFQRSEHATTVHKLQTTIEEVNSHSGRLEQENLRLRETISRLQHELNFLQTEKAGLERRLREGEAQSPQDDLMVQGLQQQLIEADEEIEELRTALNELHESSHTSLRESANKVLEMQNRLEVSDAMMLDLKALEGRSLQQEKQARKLTQRIRTLESQKQQDVKQLNKLRDSIKRLQEEVKRGQHQIEQEKIKSERHQGEAHRVTKELAAAQSILHALQVAKSESVADNEAIERSKREAQLEAERLSRDLERARQDVETSRKHYEQLLETERANQQLKYQEMQKAYTLQVKTELEAQHGERIDNLQAEHASNLAQVHEAQRRQSMEMEEQNRLALAESKRSNEEKLAELRSLMEQARETLQHAMVHAQKQHQQSVERLESNHQAEVTDLRQKQIDSNAKWQADMDVKITSMEQSHALALARAEKLSMLRQVEVANEWRDKLAEAVQQHDNHVRELQQEQAAALRQRQVDVDEHVAEITSQMEKSLQNARAAQEQKAQAGLLVLEQQAQAAQDEISALKHSLSAAQNELERHEKLRQDREAELREQHRESLQKLIEQHRKHQKNAETAQQDQINDIAQSHEIQQSRLEERIRELQASNEAQAERLSHTVSAEEVARSLEEHEMRIRAEADEHIASELVAIRQAHETQAESVSEELQHASIEKEEKLLTRVNELASALRRAEDQLVDQEGAHEQQLQTVQIEASRAAADSWKQKIDELNASHSSAVAKAEARLAEAQGEIAEMQTRIDEKAMQERLIREETSTNSASALSEQEAKHASDMQAQREDFDARMADAAKEHQESVERLKSTQKDSLQCLQQQHENELRELENGMRELRESMLSERKQGDNRMDELRSEFAAKLKQDANALKTSFEHQLEDLKTMHEATQQALASKYDRASKARDQDHQHELELLRQKLDSGGVSAASEFEAIQVEHQAQIRHMSAQWEHQAAVARAAHEAALQSQIDEQHQAIMARERELEYKHRQYVEQLQQEHRKAQSETRRALLKGVEKKQQELWHTLRETTERMDAQANVLRAQCATLRTEKEAAAAQLESEVGALRAANSEALEKASTEYAAEVAALRERLEAEHKQQYAPVLAGLRSNLDTVTSELEQARASGAEQVAILHARKSKELVAIGEAHDKELSKLHKAMKDQEHVIFELETHHQTQLEQTRQSHRETLMRAQQFISEGTQRHMAEAEAVSDAICDQLLELQARLSAVESSVADEAKSTLQTVSDTSSTQIKTPIDGSTAAFSEGSSMNNAETKKDVSLEVVSSSIPMTATQVSPASEEAVEPSVPVEGKSSPLKTRTDSTTTQLAGKDNDTSTAAVATPVVAGTINTEKDLMAHEASASAESGASPVEVLTVESNVTTGGKNASPVAAADDITTEVTKDDVPLENVSSSSQDKGAKISAAAVAASVQTVAPTVTADGKPTPPMRTTDTVDTKLVAMESNEPPSTLGSSDAAPTAASSVSVTLSPASAAGLETPAGQSSIRSVVDKLLKESQCSRAQISKLNEQLAAESASHFEAVQSLQADLHAKNRLLRENKLLLSRERSNFAAELEAAVSAAHADGRRLQTQLREKLLEFQQEAEKELDAAQAENENLQSRLEAAHDELKGVHEYLKSVLPTAQKQESFNPMHFPETACASAQEGVAIPGEHGSTYASTPSAPSADAPAETSPQAPSLMQSTKLVGRELQNTISSLELQLHSAQEDLRTLNKRHGQDVRALQERNDKLLAQLEEAWSRESVQTKLTSDFRMQAEKAAKELDMVQRRSKVTEESLRAQLVTLEKTRSQESGSLQKRLDDANNAKNTMQGELQQVIAEASELRTQLEFKSQQHMQAVETISKQGNQFDGAMSKMRQRYEADTKAYEDRLRSAETSHAKSFRQLEGERDKRIAELQQSLEQSRQKVQELQSALSSQVDRHQKQQETRERAHERSQKDARDEYEKALQATQSEARIALVNREDELREAHTEALTRALEAERKKHHDALHSLRESQALQMASLRTEHAGDIQELETSRSSQLAIAEEQAQQLQQQYAQSVEALNAHESHVSQLQAQMQNMEAVAEARARKEWADQKSGLEQSKSELQKQLRGEQKKLTVAETQLQRSEGQRRALRTVIDRLTSELVELRQTGVSMSQKDLQAQHQLHNSVSLRLKYEALYTEHRQLLQRLHASEWADAQGFVDRPS